VNKGQKIVDDFSNGNIINVQFIPLNKKKQKIKRAFELRQFYLVGCTHR
jgi:hypothetical protein